MKTIQFYLIILLCFGSLPIKAQTPVLQKDAMIVLNDQTFYTSGADYRQWYYLPQTLKPKKDKQGVPQLLFMKYSGAGESGAILHVLFDFRIAAETEHKSLQKLQGKVTTASSLQVYPFYNFFVDKKSNQLNFTFYVTDTKGKNKNKITDIQGQLNSSGAILSARLSGEEADQIWGSLQNRSQIVWLSTATSFLQKTPEKDVYVTLNLKKLAQSIQAELGKEFTAEAFYDWIDQLKKHQPELLAIKGRDLRTLSNTAQKEWLSHKLVELLTDAGLKKWGTTQQYERTTRQKVVIINGVIQKEEKSDSKSASQKSTVKWQLRSPDDLPGTALNYFLGGTTVCEVAHPLHMNISELYNHERLSTILFKQK